MPNVLITGAAGLIGNRLVRALSASGQVHAVARQHRSDAPAGVEWHFRDLSDPGFPLDLPTGLDAVIHLAQSPHFGDFPGGALDVFGVNVASTARLLDWCRDVGVPRFILASSGGIYGAGERQFTEEDIPVSTGSPLSHYVASKQCAELLAASYAGILTVTTLRFFFVYGPEQRRTMLIPRLVDSVVSGRPITLQGATGLTINPIHVDDAVAAIVRSLDLTESHKMNIAGPDVLTLHRIGDIIGGLTGKSPRYEVDPNAKPSSIVGDIGKMTRLLGPPKISFSEGVADVCAAVTPSHDQLR